MNTLIVPSPGRPLGNRLLPHLLRGPQPLLLRAGGPQGAQLAPDLALFPLEHCSRGLPPQLRPHVHGRVVLGGGDTSGYRPAVSVH